MLVKWDPYKEFERTIGEVFGRTWPVRPFWDDRNEEELAWRPAVNVYEDKDNVYIEAQVPGIEAKDVSLSVTDHTLQLRGERKVTREENQEGYHLREARYGKFARSFRMPDYADLEHVKATYEKGVLQVTVPKKEKTKVKAIEIESK